VADAGHDAVREEELVDGEARAHLGAGRRRGLEEDRVEHGAARGVGVGDVAGGGGSPVSANGPASKASVRAGGQPLAATCSSRPQRFRCATPGWWM
jgi:hypothetical protein